MGSVTANAGASVDTTGAVLQGGAGGGGVSGGTGGGGYCFAAGTMISLPDNTERPIGLIKVLEDHILVPQPDGSIRPAKVISKWISIATEWMEIGVNGKRTLVKPQHLFRTAGGAWRMIQDLEVVLERRGDTWKPAQLTHQELVQGPERLFYTLAVNDPAQAFIADGYWVKNRKPDPGDEEFFA